MTATVQIARSAPKTADAVGVPVGTSGAVPRSLGLSRAALAAHGFEGKVGQTLVVPSASGATHIAVGIGDGAMSATSVRTAVAALVRAAGKRAVVATTLVDAAGGEAGRAAQAATEGALLAAYRYAGIKKTPNPSHLRELVLVVPEAKAKASTAGAERGRVIAEAACLARDLANTPPAYLTARMMAEKAMEVGAATGLTVEVFDEHQLEEMGCGGILGVNRGSTEPPRMVRLTYTPRNPVGHLAMVGKGVMFDSGGLSLKPSDGMIAMKLDMSGAAAVLSAMSTLKALKCRAKVTGYLMCTDNMSGGDAYKLGDVLTFRNGKTAEIHNTDAEGRLVLADALAVAAEAEPDAIIDLATLTGAVMVALGKGIAGLMGNNDDFTAQITDAAKWAGESVWALPLPEEYRSALDSPIADLKNIGGDRYGG
ncbi:MAG: leucyl aminopeptidase, partial [Ilumatobacter sp.]|nr:leucyl aminopeptidase [Ilumatobacter sp.]